jgi:hypothetical protein
MNVMSPSGTMVVWTRHSPSPTESMTKLPSSAGPFSPTVLNVAFSRAPWNQVAMAAGSPPGTANRALAGSALASSAVVLPGKRGKPAGTVSQIRPQPVSVWPAAGEASGEPAGGASLGEVGWLADEGLGDAGCTVATGLRPHPAISGATRRVKRRQLARVGIGRV